MGYPGLVKGSLKQQLHAYEIEVIKKAIEAAEGDRKAAASELGIGISSLYRKLEGEANDNQKSS